MLLGVKTLKTMGIYHRDVKPGNFLFNKKERKGILIDYGLSEIVNKNNSRTFRFSLSLFIFEHDLPYLTTS